VLPDKWVLARLGHMGDVVLTTGVMEYWRRTRGWTFTCVTRAAWAPLLDGHPAVDEVVAVDDADLAFGPWRSRCRDLAARHADRGLLDLHGVPRTRILARAWKNAVRRYPKRSLARRFYAAAHWRALGRGLARTNVCQRYALAVEAAPPERGELLPRVFLTRRERDEALALLRGAGLAPGIPADSAAAGTEAGAETETETGTGRLLVALHPFATHPNKTWEPDRWRALAARLDEAGLGWFAVGAGDGVFGTPRDFTGRTALRQSCALLERAAVLVTGDSGPMHLACAVSTPVVALFGPTDPAWGFYPAGPADRVLETPGLSCRPCSLHGDRDCGRGRRCLAAITDEAVLGAIGDVLRASPGR
jgi:ADP-heptose:LPS heptosyltransferase